MMRSFFSGVTGNSPKRMRASELFDVCFDLVPEHRIRASQLCTILQLAGCTEKPMHIFVWLNEQFGTHAFVRRVRPQNVRTWVGIKPRVHLLKCDKCGALCLRRREGAV